jgi:AcrR family transcriptional regulator
MVRPKRSEQQPDLGKAIKEAAWSQIAETGAAALSLRAVARQLGITAPAIYHYFPSRDDLVTALIADAYNSLGDMQREAINMVPSGELAEQFTRLGLAYREWAIRYPQRYQLIFGTPIAGYTAPADRTVPAAAWALQPLIHILQELFNAGLLDLRMLPEQSSALQRMLQQWQAFVGDVHPDVLYLALVVWSRVHGLVSLEIGGQLPSFISDPGEVFHREIEFLRQTLLHKP